MLYLQYPAAESWSSLVQRFGRLKEACRPSWHSFCKIEVTFIRDHLKLTWCRIILRNDMETATPVWSVLSFDPNNLDFCQI